VTASLPISTEELSAFKRVLYDDAVSDWTGLWEVAQQAVHDFPLLRPSEQLAIAEVAVGQLLDAGLVELYFGDTPYGPYTPIARLEYGTVLGELRYWGNWTNPVVWVAGDEPTNRETWQSIHDAL